MPVIGHLSFGLSFLSYAQKNIVRLRVIALCSLGMGLIFNIWINSKMSGDNDLLLVIGWLTVFFLQNTYLLAKAIFQSIEAPLPPWSRELLATTFPAMHSRDWAMLMAKARRVTYKQGTTLLNIGDPLAKLQLIVSGQAYEIRNCNRRICQKGTLWGEITYVMGSENFNASPVQLLVQSDELELLEWDYELLKALSKKYPRIVESLHDGFVRSCAMKQILTWSRFEQTHPYQEAWIKTNQRHQLKLA